MFKITKEEIEDFLKIINVCPNCVKLSLEVSRIQETKGGDKVNRYCIGTLHEGASTVYFSTHFKPSMKAALENAWEQNLIANEVDDEYEL